MRLGFEVGVSPVALQDALQPPLRLVVVRRQRRERAVDLHVTQGARVAARLGLLLGLVELAPGGRVLPHHEPHFGEVDAQQRRRLPQQREDWEVGAGYLDAYEAVRLAVRSNKNRFELTTKTLASWQGDVGTSVCLPLAGCAIENEHRYTLSVPSGLSALRIGID